MEVFKDHKQVLSAILDSYDLYKGMAAAMNYYDHHIRFNTIEL